MNFDHILTNNLGLIHLIASIISLISGSLVLGMSKGTVKHKKVGYVYLIAMVVVLITAFMMYNLYGKWGIFHWMAVLSSLTLIAGFIPIQLKRPAKGYVALHFSFMYWSVIGLYGAFCAEVLVRFPKTVIESGIPNYVFYNMTGVAVALTMGVGAFFFVRNNKKWSKAFAE